MPTPEDIIKILEAAKERINKDSRSIMLEYECKQINSVTVVAKLKATTHNNAQLLIMELRKINRK